MTSAAPVKRFVKEPLRLVIAADVIFDLLGKGVNYDRRAGHAAAVKLFDAIAAGVERQSEAKVYISPVTVPLVYHAIEQRPGVPKAMLLDLFRLVSVAPLGTTDFAEALGFPGFGYVDSMEFVTYRVVGARFLVTRRTFGKKRLPVERRTAGEVVSLLH